MKAHFRLLVLAGIFLLPMLCFGQQTPTETAAIRSSATYSELLLRRTEIRADIEALLPDYTEENPKIIDLRFELSALDKSIAKILVVKPADAGKLTLGLGKLMVKKAALETEFARLTRSYAVDHPDVKRAKRRVDIFDEAIKEILK